MEYGIGSVVLDGWEIVRVIGEGSFGKVYEIRKGVLGTRAISSALKVIRVPRTAAELRSVSSEMLDERSVTSYFRGFVDEIVREIDIMSEVKAHPGVVRYEDHEVIEYPGEIRWDILIRMEKLTPLVERILARRVDAAEAVKLGREIADALDFCHGKGLLHRDVKPENIFVDELGHYKLGDFGVARTMEKSASGMSSKGTEGYMAPEVYLNRDYDARADVYSLGLVLYRLLNANRLPFLPRTPGIRAQDQHEAMLRRIKGEALPAPVQADAELAEIVLRACAYDPKERYASAGELAGALDAYGRTHRMERAARPAQATAGAEAAPADFAEPDEIRKTRMRRFAADGGEAQGAPEAEGADGRAPRRVRVERAQDDDGERDAAEGGFAKRLIAIMAALALAVGAIAWAALASPDGDGSYLQKLVWKVRPTQPPANLAGPVLDSNFFGRTGLEREQITSVEFLATLADVPVDAWDVSFRRDNSVRAWLADGEQGALKIAGMGGVRAQTSCARMFDQFANLRSVEFHGCFDTSNATNMAHMFDGCASLTALDLAGFDTSNVTDMAGMFRGCGMLTALNLSGFDTSKVADMSGMLEGCSSLTALDLSRFDTSSASSMAGMFRGCAGLVSLDLSGFSVAPATDMSGMFAGCAGLESLDMRGCAAPNEAVFASMFEGCERLQRVQWSGETQMG